jgi:hypothetical protein
LKTELWGILCRRIRQHGHVAVHDSEFFSHEKIAGLKLNAALPEMTTVLP